MKKLLFIAFLMVAAFAAKAQTPITEQFLNDIVLTNTVATNITSGGNYAGITISNSTATLGGFTNINSWLSAPNNTWVGTNAIVLTWTNNLGIWVIPTNNTPGTVTGIKFVTNDSTALVRDVPLWSDRAGQLPMTVVTNTLVGGVNSYPLSPMSMNIRMFGAASAATALNLIFVGLPDGVNEVTGANGQALTWQWGVTPAAGVVCVSTNFPSWTFAGCKTIRLRSATLTTATAANIGVTIQSLTLTGFRP